MSGLTRKERNEDTETKAYQFYGVVIPKGDDAPGHVVNLVHTHDTLVGFRRLLESLGSSDDPRYYLGVNPYGFPEHEGWPPLTGRLLEKCHIDHLADSLSDDSEHEYTARRITDMDADKLHRLLLVLSENISVEDTTPNDPYYIGLPADFAGKLDELGVAIDDFFVREEMHHK